MRPTDTATLLAKQAEAVCRHLLPNGVRKGREWCVGSLSGEEGGSLQVCIQGEKAGVWSDFASTDQKGDLIGLWKQVRSLTVEQANAEALSWLDVERPNFKRPKPTKAPSETWLRLQERLRKGTPAELASLATLRGLSVQALQLATDADQLWFAPVWDDGFDYPSWILTDDSRRNAQARKMDGRLWSGDIKAKTIAGCEAKWPVGITTSAPNLALTEGGPDLLAAWHFISLLGLKDTAPVAMFGASSAIHEDALPLFSGKRVTTFGHNDSAGQQAMAKWTSQLQSAGATVTPYRIEGHKDLNELASATVIDPDMDGRVPAHVESMFPAPQAEEGLDFDDGPASEPAPAKEPKFKLRPITAFSYPTSGDPNILLGNDDYLGRGGGFLFVSHAGAGKSSWIMDACMMWALGRPWMGIKCSGPLKSVIIQAEDSDRYVGKIFTSFAHVNNLTSEETEMLGKNCLIIRLKGVTGPDFEAALTEITDEHKPDLVIINPVYLYAQGDITRSEFAQPFLVGLDRVNKAERFAYILIHHTGKPTAKGKDGTRTTTEDWESAYMGFGSSYFANWPRCSALLEPVDGKQGSFNIKLGKGGFNAGVTKQVAQGTGWREEVTTRIAIKHSTDRMDVNGADKPVYYWELDDSPEAGEPVKKDKGGRKPKHDFSRLVQYMPKSDSAGKTLGQILNDIPEVLRPPRNSLRDLLDREIASGNMVLVKCPRYGHTIKMAF